MKTTTKPSKPKNNDIEPAGVYPSSYTRPYLVPGNVNALVLELKTKIMLVDPVKLAFRDVVCFEFHAQDATIYGILGRRFAYTGPVVHILACYEILTRLTDVVTTNDVVMTAWRNRFYGEFLSEHTLAELEKFWQMKDETGDLFRMQILFELGLRTNQIVTKKKHQLS